MSYIKIDGNIIDMSEICAVTSVETIYYSWKNKCCDFSIILKSGQKICISESDKEEAIHKKNELIKELIEGGWCE